MKNKTNTVSSIQTSKQNEHRISKFNSKATFMTNNKSKTLTRNNFNSKIKNTFIDAFPQNSVMSNISKDVFDMDLKTIRDILEVMKKHEKKCNEEGKFVEAGLLKDRIEQFKKVEEIKVFDDIQKNHENQKDSLVFEQGDALTRFNYYYDDLFNKVNTEFMEKEKEITARHAQEIERTKEDVANFFPEHPKPSAEIIKKHSSLQNLQKLRSYKEAHIVQQEIIKLTEKEYRQHDENKQKKIRDEVELVMNNQRKEYDIMTHKYLTKYSELKKERALKFDELVQKYKNKHKDLNKNQNLEMTNFKKAGKSHFIKANNGMTQIGKWPFNF